MRTLTKILLADPRLYQIAVLSIFLTYGLGSLCFELPSSYIAAVVVTTLTTQFLLSRHYKLPKVDFRSALISAISLCLLLRTDYYAVGMLAAIVAISSKFFIRINGKHIFNPTNLGIVLAIVLTDYAWISPGQWGSVAIFSFFIAGMGIFVVNRSARSDVTISFLLFHAAFLFGRAFRLGDPIEIPLHQLSNGALLIFAFYMISDPKTTPNVRTTRVLFAFLVAALAHYIRYTYYTPNALIYSLVLLSPLVPILDRLLPGTHFDWRAPRNGTTCDFRKLEGLEYAKKNLVT